MLVSRDCCSQRMLPENWIIFLLPLGSSLSTYSSDLSPHPPPFQPAKGCFPSAYLIPHSSPASITHFCPYQQCCSGERLRMEVGLWGKENGLCDPLTQRGGEDWQISGQTKICFLPPLLFLRGGSFCQLLTCCLPPRRVNKSLTLQLDATLQLAHSLYSHARSPVC